MMMELPEMLKAVDEAFEAYEFTPPPQFEKGNKKRPSKHLYLPVEIFARDMPHRARMVKPAIAAGYDVLLGASWNMMHKHWMDLPPGVVVLKSANALDGNNAFYANKVGHAIAVMNEELFSLAPDEWLYRLELDPNVMRLADVILAHGDTSARLIDKLYPAATIVEAGTPRAWPEPHPLGNEIVVCSMAGTILGNAEFKDYIAMSLRALNKPNNVDLKRLIVEQVEHEYRHYRLMHEIVAALEDEFPGLVRYRPHPVEKKEFAHDPLPFTERLKSAACVVFVSGCGTGLEATLASVPAVRVGEGGHGISRELGYPAGTDVDSVLAAVRMAVQTGAAKKPVGFMQANYSPWEPYLLEAINFAVSPLERTESLTDALEARPAFEPNDFMRNKFRDVDKDKIEAMTGHFANEFGWNLWYFR